jgi:hypothetical protein
VVYLPIPASSIRIGLNPKAILARTVARLGRRIIVVAAPLPAKPRASSAKMKIVLIG